MVAVRYYSKSGNTKSLAEAIAKGAGVIPISVDEDNAKITEDIDVLFIGGALYAYGLDKVMNDYLSGIDGKKVKKAVVFSTSWISKHSIDLIKKALKEKGIEVADETCYVRNKPNDKQLAEAEAFAKKFI
ncbi:flavodoxin family protein [Pseudobutyrivibrio ruminis]|uniref:Flavodoxin domain-containing protein n=1 Tax=Pseudobutyrivibrio ruminis DSM 9787 TaxID=1123011 RepID=A0A285SZ87_9FIRM|nr:flavodoxin family protein [Pseudobutyrivibrio ruminis]SOC14075.1 Flavodoxin domain-containing protein [Pseudobutyrivibrio ruminis DSM 9787]